MSCTTAGITALIWTTFSFKFVLIFVFCFSCYCSQQLISSEIFLKYRKENRRHLIPSLKKDQEFAVIGAEVALAPQ